MLSLIQSSLFTTNCVIFTFKDEDAESKQEMGEYNPASIRARTRAYNEVCVHPVIFTVGVSGSGPV